MPLDTSRQSAYLMSLYQAGFLPNISQELRQELEQGIMLQKERDPLRLNFPIESPERRELVKTYINAIQQGAPVVFNGPDGENNDGNDNEGDLVTSTDGFTNIFTGTAGTIYTVNDTTTTSSSSSTPPILTSVLFETDVSATAVFTDTTATTLPDTDPNSSSSPGSNSCSEPDETQCEQTLAGLFEGNDYFFGSPETYCLTYTCPSVYAGQQLCGCAVDDAICLACVDGLEPGEDCDICDGTVRIMCCYDGGLLQVYPGDCCAQP